MVLSSTKARANSFLPLVYETFTMMLLFVSKSVRYWSSNAATHIIICIIVSKLRVLVLLKIHGESHFSLVHLILIHLRDKFLLEPLVWLLLKSIVAILKMVHSRTRLSCEQSPPIP